MLQRTGTASSRAAAWFEGSEWISIHSKVANIWMQTPGTRRWRSRSFRLAWCLPIQLCGLQTPVKALHGQAGCSRRQAGSAGPLMTGTTALSGVQGLPQCSAQPVCKPAVLGRATLQRPAIKPTHIKVKTTLRLAFFFPSAAALFSVCSVPTLGLCLTSQQLRLLHLPVRVG